MIGRHPLSFIQLENNAVLSIIASNEVLRFLQREALKEHLAVAILDLVAGNYCNHLSLASDQLESEAAAEIATASISEGRLETGAASWIVGGVSFSVLYAREMQIEQQFASLVISRQLG